MTFALNWTINGETGGGSLGWSGQDVSTAFDRAQATVAAGTSQTLALQPGGTPALRFFSLMASRYTDARFAVDGQAPVTLAGAIVISGDAVRLLAAAAPLNLTVTNSGTDDLLVDVAVYRDA